MKHFFTALLAVLLTLPAVAQNTFSIRGRITDKVTGETLPGATVLVTGNGQNTGSGADSEGNYKIGNLPAGTYTVQATFVSYKPLSQTVKITAQSVVASFAMSSDNASLAEVQVVASQAQERETPVAFSAVNEVKLRETLSNRDLPMILNETPGVYATAQGGGTGDSRISVRGFAQRHGQRVFPFEVYKFDSNIGSMYINRRSCGAQRSSLPATTIYDALPMEHDRRLSTS